MAVFNDTWASLGPQPAGDIPSRYHLMPPSHLCALCWLQAGTGLTHSQGEGLTRGGGPGAGHGSHCVACLARHGPPRPLGPHQLGLLELPFQPASEVWPPEPKCVETGLALAEGRWAASYGLYPCPSRPEHRASADRPRGRANAPRHTQQDQEPAGRPAQQPQGTGRCGSVCPGQGPRGARAWCHPSHTDQPPGVPEASGLHGFLAPPQTLANQQAGRLGPGQGLRGAASQMRTLISGASDTNPASSPGTEGWEVGLGRGTPGYDIHSLSSHV